MEDLENKKVEEQDPLIAEEESIPEQKQYFRVAEVLADTVIAAENLWHSAVRGLSNLDEQHGLSQTAWSKTQEVSNKALENPYLATAVTKVSDGITMANTIYAQTMELIEEKRRALSAAVSELAFQEPTSISQQNDSTTLVAVHDNDEHTTSTQSNETLDIQINPDH